MDVAPKQLRDRIQVLEDALATAQRVAECRRREVLALRELAERCPVAVIACHPDGRVRVANEAARELFRLDGPAGASLLEDHNVLQDPLHGAAGLAGQLRRGFAGESVVLPESEYPLEARLRRRIHPLRIQGFVQPILDPDGRIAEVVLMLMEVSSRRRVEQGLSASEELFSDMAAHIRDVFWLFDWKAKRVIYASPAYEEIWGRSVQSLYDDSAGWTGSIHPDDAERARESFERIFETDGGEPREYRIRRPDGSLRWVSDRGFAIRDEHGEVVRIAGIVEDITERRRASQELLVGEQRLRSLIDHAPMVIWSVDADGLFTFSEGLGLRALGLAPGEVVGRSLFELYAGEEAIVSATRRALAGETVSSVTHVGDLVFHTRYVPVLNSDGEVTGAMGASIDITERERAEAERRGLESRLQQAQKLESLGVLAGGIAHDFNNLLMGVLGNADLALNELGPQTPIRAHLEQIEKAARRAAELTNQLLAYSGRGRFLVEPLRLSLIVSEMTELLHSVVSKKAVLRLALDPELPAIEADASQLRQVVLTLVTNASEALGDDPGQIAIAASVIEMAREELRGFIFGEERAEGSYVALEVSDTGCGMTEETLRCIYDPFFTTKFTGRGLGLAAVLGIVRAHGGAIRATSRLQEGTRVRVLLPRVSAGSAGDLGAEAPMELRSETTVLVVDDDAGVLSVAEKMLARAGLSVLEARDGRQAVEVLRDHAEDVSLVILDLTMPQLSGEQTLPLLREIRPDLPVLLSSGYTEQEAERRISGLDIAGFLQKPYSSSQLRRKIREALGEEL